MIFSDEKWMRVKFISFVGLLGLVKAGVLYWLGLELCALGDVNSFWRKDES